MRVDELPSALPWPSGPGGPPSPQQGEQAFARAMEQAQAAQGQTNGETSRVMRLLKPQDTLSQVVRQEILGRGIEMNTSQHLQEVLTVARENQLTNPDRVKAGQTLNLSLLHARLDQLVQRNTPERQTDVSMPNLAGATSAFVQDATAIPTASARGISTSETTTVLTHDTLSQIVRQEARSRGIQLSRVQIYKAVLSLAKDNQIDNPDHIVVGQQLKLGQLRAELTNPTSAIFAYTDALPKKSEQGPLKSEMAQGVQSNTPAAEPHPILRQTLQRAVARGFIPANEQQDVYNKILQVANKHRFSPDDFARLTLMESDGMNPQASNQRCHGIIQFCDGPSRGAASVGYAQAPRAILNLSVYQQLHLVDAYFNRVGLNKQGRVQLDDLYLAVLQPTARAETRLEVPLPIPGSQAAALYEGRNPQGPITRNSIIQGLIKNTLDRLSNPTKPVGAQVSENQPSRSLQTPPAAAYQPITYQEKM